MSLNLDPRQRAMLLEMGVHVWQPPAPVAPGAPAAADGAAPAAPETIAARPGAARAEGNFGLEPPARPAPAAPVPGPAAPAPAARREAVPVAMDARSAAPPAGAPADADAPAPWRLGAAQPLYAEGARPGGARWLVLAQGAPGALDAPVLAGEAGRLLDNMLRAARLHQGAGAVLCAPLVRQAVAGPAEGFAAALQTLLDAARPDVVLVMGRLAAQALLHTHEPFGRLRGRAHTLHGRPLVVTHDAPYLLRCPQDKAKAWDDLCLALQLAASAG